MSRPRHAVMSCIVAALAVATAMGEAPAPRAAVVADLDLARPFATRSPWRLTARQGPPVDAVIGMGETAPGEIVLCLHRAASETCAPDLQETLGEPTASDLYARPHYLNAARIVHQASGRPLLLVQTASRQGVNGDQRIQTQALAYRKDSDRFERVYAHLNGRNNNQEVRFVDAGPLRGDIVSAEPTADAPFGFWVEVDAPAPDGAYRQVLRYRSATRYGDGNSLAVIDSETPDIQRRMGLWRPGEPLPLPARACPKPHMVGDELWCG